MPVANVFYVSGRNKITDKLIFLFPVFNFGKVAFSANIFNVFESGNFSAVRLFVRFDSEVEYCHKFFSLSPQIYCLFKRSYSPVQRPNWVHR